MTLEATWKSLGQRGTENIASQKEAASIWLGQRAPTLRGCCKQKAHIPQNTEKGDNNMNLKDNRVEM